MPFTLSCSSLRSRLAVVVAAGLLVAGVWSPTAGAETPAPGRVGGLVLDRGNQSVAGATVTLTDNAGAAAGSASTDNEGRWSIAVSQGDYDVAVRAHQDGHTVSARVRHYTVEENTKLNLILAGDPDQTRVAAAALSPDAGTGDPADPAFTRAAAATAQTVTFSGRVVDADGDPAHNVAIRLQGAEPYQYAEVFVEEYDGTFTLDVPVDTYTLGLETDAYNPDDCYGCVPDRTERQTHHFIVEDFRLDGDRQETIRLPRPTVMTVTVVDPDNHPVQGAWVTSGRHSPNQPPAIAAALFPGATPTVTSDADVRTGADGTASVEYFPGTEPTNISVQPPAATQLPAEIAVPPDTTSLTVRLQDGPTLRGRLIQAGQTTPYDTPEGYISGENGSFPIAVTRDGYAVTAPPGRYQMHLEVSHDEEGESSDYWIWGLDTGDFDIVGDQVLDLNVPLGQARLWVVDDQGQRLDGFYTFGFETTSDITIGGGIRATTWTDSEAWPDDEEYLAVIGPSLTQHLHELDDYPGAPASAYVAPDEHTVIAFVAGTGPGYAAKPPTTTATTQPTTTTTTRTTSTPTNSGPVGDPPAGPASQAGTSTGSGYWTLSSDGTVHQFGAAAHLGNSAAGAVDVEPTPAGKGYWVLNRNGVVQAFGDAVKLGDVELGKLANDEEPASLSAAPSGKGYWVFTNRGRTVPFGDASFHGDVSDVKLNGPVLGSVATPSGQGYYMVASDGGIFAFGDARFEGSMGGTRLNQPVQSLVPDSDGNGYWLVASDGGIFAFDASFKGSLGGTKLNKPVVGMVRYGDGYLMVGADGGIFNFSTAPFAGSLGDKPPASPVVAVAALP